MARVTVEDCIERLPNRFELVMVAAQRARKIGSGAALTIERDNDKNPVVSLREVAGETVGIDELKEELVRNHQRIVAMDDDDDEDVIQMMDGEEEWGTLVSQASEGVEPVAGGSVAPAAEETAPAAEGSAPEMPELDTTLAELAGEIRE